MKWFPPASMLTLQHLAKLTLLESEDGGNLFLYNTFLVHKNSMKTYCEFMISFNVFNVHFVSSAIMIMQA